MQISLKVQLETQISSKEMQKIMERGAKFIKNHGKKYKFCQKFVIKSMDFNKESWQKNLNSDCGGKVVTIMKLSQKKKNVNFLN